MRRLSDGASGVRRSTFTLLAWVVAALGWAGPSLASGGGSGGTPGGEGRPNVLLLISDDQAWSDFGFMGHGVIETPRLD
ncbi:MAG: hypothetical protein ACPGPE_05015, partial [Planctomycetota bacterium]